MGPGQISLDLDAALAQGLGQGGRLLGAGDGFVIQAEVAIQAGQGGQQTPAQFALTVERFGKALERA